MSEFCRNLTPKKKQEPLRVSCNALRMPTWSSESPVAPSGQWLGGAAVGKGLACSFWQALPAIRALCFLFGLKRPQSIGRGVQGCLAEFSGRAKGDPVTQLARLGTTPSKPGQTQRSRAHCRECPSSWYHWKSQSHGQQKKQSSLGKACTFKELCWMWEVIIMVRATVDFD